MVGRILFRQSVMQRPAASAGRVPK